MAVVLSGHVGEGEGSPQIWKGNFQWIWAHGSFSGSADVFHAFFILVKGQKGQVANIVPLLSLVIFF